MTLGVLRLITSIRDIVVRLMVTGRREREGD